MWIPVQANPYGSTIEIEELDEIQNQDKSDVEICYKN